jgi:hypothetical protein
MAYVTTIDISSLPGSAYTWETALFAWNDPDGRKTWDDVRPVVYTLRVGEGWSAEEAWWQQYQLTSREGWHMAEGLVQVFACLIQEAWRISEGWTDVWLALMKIVEGWTVAEVTRKSVHISQAEGWGIMVSLPVWNMLQATSEAWNTAEADQETVDFHYKAVESFLLDESLAKSATKSLSETFTPSDGWAVETIKNLWEVWQTQDSAATRNSFERVLAESFSTADSISKDQISTFFEAMETVEAYLRSANAVVSDLAFGSGDLSLDEFLKLNAPVGYSPFTAFVPGELEYRKALIALILKGTLTTGRPRITDWQLTVDVPDQTDGGTSFIPAANTFIPFQRRFYAPPQVLVQLRGGSGGTPDITHITEAGFYVQISDATGSILAGDIIWSADGY